MVAGVVLSSCCLTGDCVCACTLEAVLSDVGVKEEGVEEAGGKQRNSNATPPRVVAFRLMSSWHVNGERRQDAAIKRCSPLLDRSTGSAIASKATVMP